MKFKNLLRDTNTKLDLQEKPRFCNSFHILNLYSTQNKFKKKKILMKIYIHSIFNTSLSFLIKFDSTLVIYDLKAPFNADVLLIRDGTHDCVARRKKGFSMGVSIKKLVKGWEIIVLNDKFWKFWVFVEWMWSEKFF